jgi:type III pantothenate kinase
MLLAIDAGNSNVAFAVYSGLVRKSQWRIRTRPERTADEFAALLANLLDATDISVSQITECVVCSVVPQTTPDLIRLCRDYYGVDPLLIGSDLDLGIDVRYKPAGDVGTDRLVDAAMALDRYGPAPLIVLDLGTGTTFNAVGPPNLYLGGAICPGLGVAWDAMFERAARLYRVEAVKPPSVLADNTLHALQSGMVYGAVSMIDGMVRRIQADMKAPSCIVVATGGGLSQAICESSETITHVDPHLTLDGLALAFRRNRTQAAS